MMLKSTITLRQESCENDQQLVCAVFQRRTNLILSPALIPASFTPLLHKQINASKMQTIINQVLDVQ